MKKSDIHRFFDFIAAMMFVYDVDWDEEVPALITDDDGDEAEPAIAAVAGKRSYTSSAAS